MYSIKWLQELGWALLIAVVVVLATALTGVEDVTDWKAWAVGLLGSVARVAGATVLNAVRKIATTAE